LRGTVPYNAGMLRAYMTDAITWIQAGEPDEWGEPTATTETDIKARVEWGERRVVDQSGTERLASALVHMSGKPAPGSDKFNIDGTEYSILSYHEKKSFKKIRGYTAAIA